MGYGMIHVAGRPQQSALIEFKGGTPSLHAALPAPEPGHGATLRLLAVKF